MVEWPAQYRGGYDVDLTEGKVCEEPHVVLNAYALCAIVCANRIAALLGQQPSVRRKRCGSRFILRSTIRPAICSAIAPAPIT